METDISGIILFPQDQPFFSNELLWMNLQKYPLVLMDRYLPRLNTSYVIADKSVRISPYRTLVGHQSYPLAIAKGTTV